MDNFVPNRRRHLEDMLDDEAFGDNEEDEEQYVPMNVDELTSNEYTTCFACERINTTSMRSNEKYMAMMRMYSTNVGSMTKEAIFKLIKKYFDEFIKPDLREIGDMSDWSLECVRNHFQTHTNFPTDEINHQLRIKRALRNHLANNLVDRSSEGKMKFNLNHIKMVSALDKEILVLLKSKKDISGMLHFSELLDY
jgi:hypothetical protein